MSQLRPKSPWAWAIVRDARYVNASIYYGLKWKWNQNAGLVLGQVQRRSMLLFQLANHKPCVTQEFRDRCELILSDGLVVGREHRTTQEEARRAMGCQNTDFPVLDMLTTHVHPFYERARLKGVCLREGSVIVTVTDPMEVWELTELFGGFLHNPKPNTEGS